jgi:hypothetical protein
MAWTLSLQNDDTTINLNDGTTYTALSPFNAPVPPRRTSVGGRNMSRHGSDVTNRVFNNRTVTFTVLISGTSQDNLIANINAIHSLLERASEYAISGLGSQVILRRKWENATNQVDFHVLDGLLTIGDEFAVTHRINTKVAGVITLLCEPFAYGAEETIQNFVLDSGFELAGTALADWTESKTATGTTARDTSVKKDGLASLKLTMTDSGGSGQVIERNQVLADVDAGEVWSFQCWVRVDALSNAKVVMELDYNTGTDVEVATTTVNASSFVKLTANNNTVPGSVTQVTLRLRLEATAADATGVVYIDNVIAVLASAVPTAWVSSASIANHQADDSQATSNYIDIEDIPGDMPAELQVRIQEGQDHDEFWAGAKHAAQQYDDLYLEGEASTTNVTTVGVSGYTHVNNGTESDSSHSDGSARKVSSERPGSGASALGGTLTAYYRLDYAMATIPKGTYRCLVAVKVGVSGGSNAHNAAQWAFGMGWTYGDVSLLHLTTPATASFVEMPAQAVAVGAESNREILDLGTVTIPPIRTPDNMTDGTFTLSIYCGWDETPSAASYLENDAGQTVAWYIDFIHLMPTDRGSNYTTKGNDTDYVLLDSMSPAKGLYLVSSSDVVESFPSGQLGRSPEAHPNGTRIYFLAKGTSTLTKGDTFTVRVRYRPRFLQVMGA